MIVEPGKNPQVTISYFTRSTPDVDTVSCNLKYSYTHTYMQNNNNNSNNNNNNNIIIIK